MPANSAWTEIITTTLKKREKSFTDNITAHIPLLKFVERRGNLKLESGGETLVEELEYAENGSFKYYSGAESLDLTINDVFSAAEFNWAQASVVVQAHGLELRQNSGNSRQIDLLESRMKNAERTMMNQLDVALYSAGTDAKVPLGLRLFVEGVAPASQTSTVGGISRADYSFWRNQATVTGTAVTSSNVLGYLNSTWLACVRNADSPDLIIMDDDHYKAYWSSLQALQQIIRVDSGTSGYEELAYAGPGGRAAVMYAANCPDKTTYLLNTNYIKWRVHKDANYTPLDERHPLAQDAVGVPIIWQGQNTISNCARQGVIVEA